MVHDARHPAIVPEDADPLGERPAALRSRPPTAPMRVLLIEDNPNLVRSLLAGMGKAGMLPDAVSDGLQADQLLKTEDYDAVVLDLALPRLDGMEVLRRARARGNDVPVLILTASGELTE